MVEARIKELLENLAANQSEYISDAEEHTPPSNRVYTKITVVADATINDITPAPLGNDITGNVLPARTELKGRYTSITLTAGAVIAEVGIR